MYLVSKENKVRQTVKLLIPSSGLNPRNQIYRRPIVDNNQTAHISLQIHHNVKKRGTQDQNLKPQRQKSTEHTQSYQAHPASSCSILPPNFPSNLRLSACPPVRLACRQRLSAAGEGGSMPTTKESQPLFFEKCDFSEFAQKAPLPPTPTLHGPEGNPHIYKGKQGQLLK